MDSPRSLDWEPIVKDGQIVGMICPRCMTYDDMRKRRDELAKLAPRLKQIARAGSPPPDQSPGERSRRRTVD
jgi:hypothetical protein